MNSLVSKIKNMFRSMKLTQRMLLIYFIGGFMPVLAILWFFNDSLNDIQLEQVINGANDRMQVEAQLEVNTMDFTIELSEKFRYDTNDKKLVLNKYLAGRDLRVDYHNFSELEEYYENFYKDIDNISVYFEQSIVENDNSLIDNRHFRLITDTIKSKEWYIKTTHANGEPYWSYVTNMATDTKSYRMSRNLYDQDGKVVGVISIALKNNVGGSFVDVKDGGLFNAVIYDNKTTVMSSDYINNVEFDFIRDILNNHKTGRVVNFRGEKCIVSSAKVYPRNSNDHYSLVSIQSFDEISKENRSRVMRSYAPVFLGVIFISLAIFFLMRWFSKRMRSLLRAMRRVTYGNYNVEDTEIEKYSDEIFDLYNTLKNLVSDMQHLQEVAANERIQKEQMYSRQKDVEFKMLATQINPHFLYNTLENIRMMASINGQKDIADMSFNLTKLLRKTLNAGKGLKSLLWEMEMVENYITIQNYRFGERIRAVIDYDKNQAVDYQIIPFVVQPFVENAYVHAMESMEGGGVISISAHIGEDITLIIEDNGCGMSEEKLAEVTKYLNDFDNIDRTHIGIVNVNQRIKLQFGDEYGVIFTSTEGKGTRVEITMPVIENES